MKQIGAEGSSPRASVPPALNSLFLAYVRSFVLPPSCTLPRQGHHVATLSVLVDPLLQKQHAFYTACALLVEFNTFLLILRRRVSWGGYLEVPFALSWVALRLVW